MSDSPTLFLDAEYPEVLADIAREVHQRLMTHPKAKLPHPVAAEVALQVAESVRKNIGGVSTYIPRGHMYEISVRDRKLWEEFKGDNYQELAHRYDMTEMRVRQIVARVAAAERAKRQQNLFEAE
jgi:Mor family transcriptional regulator